MAHLTKNDLNIYKIARTIGHATTDLGKLCTSVKINLFSRYKPMYGNHDGRLTLQEITSRHYGTYGLHYSTPQAMFSATSLSIVWDRPIAPYFRIRDFAADSSNDTNYGYFHRAHNPFMQAMGTRYTIDVVQNIPDPIIFYLLFNTTTSYLYDRGFSPVSGIDYSITEYVPLTDLPCNLAAEDLVYQDAQLSDPQYLLDATNPARLGILIYTNLSGSASTPWFSSVDLTTQTDQRRTEMYNISTANIWDTSLGGVAIGTYTAIACAEKTVDNTTYYLPVCSVPAFPAKFILDVGGLNNYSYLRVGIGTNTTNFFTSLVTTEHTLFLSIVFYNKSRKSLTLLLSKLTLTVDIYGSVAYNGGASQPIDRHNVVLTRVDSTGHDDATTQVVLPATYKSSVNLLYRLDDVWSINGTSGAQLPENGSVIVTPVLKFNNQANFSQESSVNPFTVTTN